MTGLSIDSHFHIWDLQRYAYPWLSEGEPISRIYGSTAPLRQSYWLDSYRRDLPDLQGAVYVQCGMRDPLNEARIIDQLSQDSGFPMAIIAHVDLLAPKAALEIAEFSRIEGLRGFRQNAAWHPDPTVSFHPQSDTLHHPALPAALDTLQAKDLIYEVMIFAAWQGERLAELACQHPALKVVVNHLGLATTADDPERAAWLQALRSLAACPNVHVKISGMTMWAPHWWQSPADQAPAREALRLFGADRCMFGSNFPIDRLHLSFAQIASGFDELCRTSSEEDAKALRGGSARKLYRL